MFEELEIASEILELVQVERERIAYAIRYTEKVAYTVSNSGYHDYCLSMRHGKFLK